MFNMLSWIGLTAGFHLAICKFSSISSEFLWLECALLALGCTGLIAVASPPPKAKPQKDNPAIVTGKKKVATRPAKQIDYVTTLLEACKGDVSKLENIIKAEINRKPSISREDAAALALSRISAKKAADQFQMETRDSTI